MILTDGFHTHSKKECRLLGEHTTLKSLMILFGASIGTRKLHMWLAKLLTEDTSTRKTTLTPRGKHLQGYLPIWFVLKSQSSTWMKRRSILGLLRRNHGPAAIMSLCSMLKTTSIGASLCMEQLETVSMKLCSRSESPPTSSSSMTSSTQSADRSKGT